MTCFLSQNPCNEVCKKTKDAWQGEGVLGQLKVRSMRLMNAEEMIDMRMGFIRNLAEFPSISVSFINSTWDGNPSTNTDTLGQGEGSV